MKKKHILVIGGTHGIGREVVLSLLNNGHTVSVVGRHIPSYSHARVHYWTIDLSQTASLSRSILNIIAKDGKISHLIFCQRFRGEGDNWTGEFSVSLTATKIIIDTLIPYFDRTPERSIAIIASLASFLVGHEQPVGYHIGKAGLVHLMRYYAVVLGPKGIRVNCVSPCTILKDESKKFYLENTKLQKLYKQIIPLGRMGTAKEIANVLLFLCSRESSFITGQNIIADGGLALTSQERLARDLVYEKAS